MRKLCYSFLSKIRKGEVIKLKMNSYIYTGYETTISSINIEDAQIPLASVPDVPTWSVFNLAIAVFMILVLIVAMLRKKRGKVDSEEYDEAFEYKFLVVQKLATIIMAVIVAVFFGFTENLQYEMGYFNGFSLLYVSFAITQLAIQFYRPSSQIDKNEDAMENLEEE